MCFNSSISQSFLLHTTTVIQNSVSFKVHSGSHVRFHSPVFSRDILLLDIVALRKILMRFLSYIIIFTLAARVYYNVLDELHNLLCIIFWVVPISFRMRVIISFHWLQI